MTNSLASAIAALASTDAAVRFNAAQEIYSSGRALADSATREWWKDTELSALLRATEADITVGIAVHRETFSRIHWANGSPRLAHVPPDQDAEEFELYFPKEISLDVLTSREPGGTGVIAKYLARFGEGIQQVELKCADVDRATAILKDKLGITAIYPQTRPGADETRVNFFLLPTPGSGKVLVELYERA
jgi:hypothetical protein